LVAAFRQDCLRQPEPVTEEPDLRRFAFQEFLFRMVEDVVELHQPEFDLPVRFLAAVPRIRLSDQPIKQLGEFGVSVRVGPQITANVRVVIKKEE